ncbi:MAG: IS200/IS605 family transposase [Candidatus Pacebacteria bacterium]|nr:IS200/IS605 family transposase [Candidatus Paceibacterota bacterium]
MRLYQLSHCKYRCQYHLVWIPRYREKVMADNYIKAELGRIFKTIAKWKGFKIQAWHIGDDHIHLVVDIPPKYSVSYIMSVIKGKSSSWIKKKTKKLPKGSLWAKGYFVSTVGVDEMTIKNYVRHQEHHQINIPKLPL